MMLSPEPFRVNFQGQQHLAKNIGWLTSGTCQEGVAPIGGIGDFGESRKKKNGESLIESVTETRPCPVEMQLGGHASSRRDDTWGLWPTRAQKSSRGGLCC